ncbi:MAG: hypothetical protein JSS62_06165 [Verrucomicrobia bacterium]|nr:hypothetical protein [Verrucomicrobiota bacterium]
MSEPSKSIISSQDVSAHYTEPAVASLGVHKVSKLEVKGGPNPLVRYVVAVLKNIGLYFVGKWNQAFKGVGFQACQYALAPQTRAVINQQVMFLGNASSFSPAEKSYFEGWAGAPEAGIPPRLSELEQNVAEMKKEMAKPDGKHLFHLPIATLIGSELHVVGLVVDTKDQQIFFLDTKGRKPEELYVTTDRNREKSDMTCADVIQQVVQKGGLEDYHLFLTPDIQKPRDCAICVTAMVGNIAKRAERSSAEQIQLADVVADIHGNYDQIDEIRAQHFRPKER